MAHDIRRVGAYNNMAEKTIFIETTPLGHRVVLTRDRWRFILRRKHPALTGHELDVRDCVRDPEVIREGVCLRCHRR
jgi:hypothetical protein